MAHLPIWYINTIPHNTCDKLVAELSSLPSKDATMGIDGDQLQHSTRNTNVRFAEQGHWFESALKQTAYEGNEACKWEYLVTGSEAIQFAEYGVNQHYHWHTDTFTLSGNPTERKLTVVCLLNDPSEFEGGEFQVRLYNDYTAPLTKGSVIAFPSILEHRVTPVLSGVRHSATIWLNGPRFR
jgi:PKHD-type hydroxylase